MSWGSVGLVWLLFLFSQPLSSFLIGDRSEWSSRQTHLCVPWLNREVHTRYEEKRHGHYARPGAPPEYGSSSHCRAAGAYNRSSSQHLITPVAILFFLYSPSSRPQHLARSILRAAWRMPPTLRSPGSHRARCPSRKSPSLQFSAPGYATARSRPSQSGRCRRHSASIPPGRHSPCPAAKGDG